MEDRETGAPSGAAYSVGEFARLTGVTERALRFYDRKGLLKPSGRNAQGHRIYTDADLLQLQRIVTLKYLDFSLEDIARHLGEPGHDLLGTLNLQYELLNQKRERLDRVLATMERMRAIVEGLGTIDNALLLMFIHNIRNEQAQKEALSRYMPESLVRMIFMDNLSPEDRLEKERRMTAAMAELLAWHRAGRHPGDPEVLASGERLLELLMEVIEPLLDSIGQGTEPLEALADPALQDPVITQTGMAEEEERFMAEVLERLNALERLTKGEDKHHGG